MIKVQFPRINLIKLVPNKISALMSNSQFGLIPPCQVFSTLMSNLTFCLNAPYQFFSALRSEIFSALKFSTLMTQPFNLHPLFKCKLLYEICWTICYSVVELRVIKLIIIQIILKFIMFNPIQKLGKLITTFTLSF